MGEMPGVYVRTLLLFSHVMHINFPTSVIVLRVLSSEGHVMPPDFLQQGIRLNAACYTEEIGIVTKPRIDHLCDGMPYAF